MKQSIRVLSVFVFGFAIGACSNQELGSRVAVTGGFTAGIIHGMEIPASNHPEAVKITAGGGMCTGVFIEEDPPTLLTASHCLKALPTAKSNDGGVKYGSARSRRACVPKGAIAHVNPYDMAVVVFDKGTVNVPGIARITPTDPKADMQVTLVGFGRNTGLDTALISGAGKKRLGLNTIHQIVSNSPLAFAGMIELKGNLDGDIPEQQIQSDHDSSPNHGDSGGPLYIHLESGEYVAGLVSGGRVEKGVSTAYYTNLATTESRTFLSRALDSRFLDGLAKTMTQSDYQDVCAIKKEF